MADLNLTDQATLRNTIAPKMQDLRNAMDLRKTVWDRISFEKKKQWIVSDKDPIMTLAWQTYRYLRDNFFLEEEQYG